MIVKDHFLTGESFEIKKVSKGVMSTFPTIDNKKLKPYYNSPNYIIPDTALLIADAVEESGPSGT